MTVIDGLRCTWDFRDHLVAVEDDTMRADYRYDFTGRRVIKKVTRKKGEPQAQGADSAPVPAPKPASTSALYPTEHFEVRDADQPTKYVVNGSARVAHVIGSLSTNERIQRLRLRAGPNLISLAVTAENLAGELQAETISVPVIKALYRWSDAAGSYAPVNTGQTVPAGAIVWIHAATNAVLSVVGSYAEPAPRAVPPGGQYVAGPGLETWSPSLPASLACWAYSTADRRWQAQLPASLLPVSELPQIFPPGQVLYVNGGENAELAVPDPTCASAIIIRITRVLGGDDGRHGCSDRGNGILSVWSSATRAPASVCRRTLRVHG
jgi:hypothetical protein